MQDCDRNFYDQGYQRDKMKFVGLIFIIYAIKQQLVPILYFYLMKSEELFEIDRQINQIKKSYQQRQERINQWNVSVSSVLKEKQNKQYYLSKKYSQCHLDFYQPTQNNPAEAFKHLQQHNRQSRIKVRQFKNDLHQLHNLIKKRNVIRLAKINEENLSKKYKIDENTKICYQKQFSKTIHDKNQAYKKKQRENSVFQNLKGEKLLQILQQSKAKYVNNQQVINNVKKQLGIGIQNTPFYAWLQQKTHSEKLLQKNKSKCLEASAVQIGHFNLSKQFNRDVKKKKNIYLSTNKLLGKDFQMRLKRIIRYHETNLDNIKLIKIVA